MSWPRFNPATFLLRSWSWLDWHSGLVGSPNQTTMPPCRKPLENTEQTERGLTAALLFDIWTTPLHQTKLVQQFVFLTFYCVCELTEILSSLFYLFCVYTSLDDNLLFTAVRFLFSCIMDFVRKMHIYAYLFTSCLVCILSPVKQLFSCLFYLGNCITWFLGFFDNAVHFDFDEDLCSKHPLM